MLRILLFLLIVVHGLIHAMGFAKAFHYGNVTGLIHEITKPAGVLWLITAFLFLAAGLMFLMNKELWWTAGAAGLFMSQYLVFASWSDAKFGTIANVIILIAILLSLSRWKI